MRRCRPWLFALLGVLLLTGGARAAIALPEPVRLSPHAWGWIGPYGPPTRENEGFRMNLGFVVGGDAVAVVDSGYGTKMAQAILAHIRRITDRPVAYVVNTDSQPHRVLGNDVFRAQGARILAARDAVPRMVEEGAAMARAAEGILGGAPGSIQPPGAPHRALTGRARLDLGGVTVNVIPVGTAHTAGSLVVQVVEDGVVFAGDVLYGGRLLSVLPVSSVDGWIAAFDALHAFEDALFVPGHGSPGALRDFEHPTREYLNALRAHMDDAAARDADMQDAIESMDQNRWRHLADFDALAGRNAHQVYLEREAAAFE